jgi:hypothetical protein
MNMYMCIIMFSWKPDHEQNSKFANIYGWLSSNTGYQVRQILERHLVVADRAYTMADLKQIANDTVVLPTVRDHLKLRIKESDKSKLNSSFEQE